MIRITLFMLLMALCVSGTGTLPHNHRTQWNPGIPGGIPPLQSTTFDVTEYGGDPKGLSDCKTAVTEAMNALPPDGGVIYFPQGTYIFNGTISVSKSNVVFRGDGIEKTRLLHDHDGLCFDIVTYKRGTWQNILSGDTAGSMSVTVEDGSKFIKGGFAELRQANDSLRMYTDSEWIQSWADSAVGQLVEVTLVSGNTITFRTPLHFSFNKDLSPQIRPQGFVTNVGFENFYIERLKTGNSTIQFKNAAYCWVRNVESYHTCKSHITNNTTLGCEYRDSYFHHSFTYGDGGSGYGVEFGYHCTDGLCENNIFDSLRHAMMVHIGTSGTVFGYNYSLHPVQGEGELILNDGWNPPDISLHGHYAQMNLFESNIVQEIGVGDYWGPMGPGNTFLRNVVMGEGIFVYDHSNGQNFIGNVLTAWQTDSTSDSLFRHGERVNGSLLWDMNITNHQIPNTYYLMQKPLFYGTMEWPSTGSDIEKPSLPAVIRFRPDVQIQSEQKLKHPRSPFKILHVKKNVILVELPSRKSCDYSVMIADLNGKKIRTIRNEIRPGLMIIQIISNKNMSGIFCIVLNDQSGKQQVIHLPIVRL